MDAVLEQKAQKMQQNFDDKFQQLQTQNEAYMKRRIVEIKS